MRWSTAFFSVSLLAALHGVSHAQTYSSAARSPAISYPAPYAPGCATLGMPLIGSRVPGIGSLPGTGSIPGSTPGSGDGETSAGAVTAVAATAAPSASGGESGFDSLASATPQMIGDLLGYGRAFTMRNATGNPGTGTVFASRGAFKISENESPRPTDRVFVTGNYFNGARGFDNRLDVYRGLIGFEKTFLDGNASFGLRAPMQQSSGGGTGIDGFGDLSLIGKYAFINDTQTGTVASGGLVLTVPTGRSVALADGRNLDAVLIQPWIGGILVMGDAYALGFSSIIASTASPDPTLYTLDLGVGYRIYQSHDNSSILTSITPTFEGHLTTSLNNNQNSQIIFSDQFILTGGVHLGLFNRAYFTIGGAVPVTGGRLNDFEVIAQFNYRF
jgi:hypothetical protein